MRVERPSTALVPNMTELYRYAPLLRPEPLVLQPYVRGAALPPEIDQLLIKRGKGAGVFPVGPPLPRDPGDRARFREGVALYFAAEAQIYRQAFDLWQTTGKPPTREDFAGLIDRLFERGHVEGGGRIFGDSFEMTRLQAEARFPEKPFVPRGSTPPPAQAESRWARAWRIVEPVLAGTERELFAQNLEYGRQRAAEMVQAAKDRFVGAMDAFERRLPHFPPDENSPLGKAWRDMNGKFPTTVAEFLLPPVPAEPDSPLAQGRVAGLGAANPAAKAVEAAKPFLPAFPPEPGSPIDNAWQALRSATWNLLDQNNPPASEPADGEFQFP